ncbi:MULTISPECIES: sigma-54-dependent Fis family transcriptional regulator [Amycolatopsis]|nr:helix-turn-helix domain-containing protein [Amycolatopsis sacchari]
MSSRLAWEAFQHGDEPPDLREEILTSWRRSRLSGVSPLAQDFERIEIDIESRFARVAIPLMTEMAELLADSETCLAMANGAAHVLWRWAPDSRLRHQLDLAGLLVGHSFNEELIGTNAVGTSLEVGRTAAVRSEEHYREAFHRFNCVATPVVDPITHRILGTINLTWSPNYQESAVAPLVQKMAREVQTALKDAAGARERRLLDAFLDARARSAHPVVALNSELIIGNHLAPVPNFRHEVLWGRVLDTVDGPDLTIEVAPGWSATVRAIFDGKSLLGALLVFDTPQHETPVPTVSAGPPHGATASAHARVRETVGRVVRDGGAVVLRGEPGVGKKHVVVDALGAGAEVLDASDIAADGPEAWLGMLRRSLNRTTPLVVTHLDSLDQRTARAVASILSAAAEPPRLGATVTVGRGEQPAWLLSIVDALGATVIDLGPLRNRQDEIQPLADTFAGDVPLAPETREVLQRYTWPGNVAELRQAVRTAVVSSDGTVVNPAHLPDSVRLETWTNRHLSLIERAEAEVITRVLTRANGNKTVAARELGVSRPTLYAKIRAYRISVPTTHVEVG